MDLVQLRDDLEKGIMICKLRWFELVDFAEKQASDLKQARGALLQPITEMGELQMALERIAALEAELAKARKEPENDSSMPIDMSEAKRWIVQLRGRVNHLLGVINTKQPPAVQAGQWISVKDRMPGLHQLVVIKNENLFMNVPFDCDIPWTGTAYLSDGGYMKYWSVFNINRGIDSGSVTHWMPLPPPPVAEQAQEAKP